MDMSHLFAEFRRAVPLVPEDLPASNDAATEAVIRRKKARPHTIPICQAMWEQTLEWRQEEPCDGGLRRKNRSKPGFVPRKFFMGSV